MDKTAAKCFIEFQLRVTNFTLGTDKESLGTASFALGNVNFASGAPKIFKSFPRELGKLANL